VQLVAGITGILLLTALTRVIDVVSGGSSPGIAS
jgi:hypothetical protein